VALRWRVLLTVRWCWCTALEAGPLPGGTCCNPWPLRWEPEWWPLTDLASVGIGCSPGRRLARLTFADLKDVKENAIAGPAVAPTAADHKPYAVDVLILFVYDSIKNIWDNSYSKCSTLFAVYTNAQTFAAGCVLLLA